MNVFTPFDRMQKAGIRKCHLAHHTLKFHTGELLLFARAVLCNDRIQDIIEKYAFICRWTKKETTKTQTLILFTDQHANQ